MPIKIVRFTDSLIDKLIILCMIPILLIGSYLIYDNVYIFNNSKADKVSSYKPENAEQAHEILKQLSEDCVAWVTINDTDIDYPIMQGEDNIEYLNKNPYGEYILSGSIFLDSRNKSDFSDKYSLVYGHHMEQGYLFGALDYWFDKSFFDSHLDGTITTEGGILYKYKLFAICETDASVEEIFNPVNNYPMEYIKENATHFNEPVNGNLVILSTCKSPTSTKRIILCGMIYN